MDHELTYNPRKKVKLNIQERGGVGALNTEAIFF